MQVDGTRLYRVRAVARMLDVSVATIYRAIESGQLTALRIGIGQGAIRVPGEAVEEFTALCTRLALAGRGVVDTGADAEATGSLGEVA
jgi:excisionase family DNA binding protein